MHYAAANGQFDALKVRESFIDNLLVRVHFIIVTIRWTGLAPLDGDARLLSDAAHLTLCGPRPLLRARPLQLRARNLVVRTHFIIVMTRWTGLAG